MCTHTKNKLRFSCENSLADPGERAEKAQTLPPKFFVAHVKYNSIAILNRRTKLQD